ncbi:Ribosomal protein S12 methylthiotransferase RimO [Labeo rohita]|uniref:Ribosomal protein S12 methylthiotransferase RimO n=1 Tax=Labeo rohita TaxID=84645 RepID=A0ABQ8MVB6_LABRO|nr:Ribosomal protein S12 methylthiotransferase RimO [Labeo rohita]
MSEASTRRPVELPTNVSFCIPEEDRMSIAKSEDGLTPEEADESVEWAPAAAAAQPESEAELTAMLLQAAKSIDQEHSQLNDWFLGAGSDVPPRSTPEPFFLEVHEELTKMWQAPYTVRLCLSSSLLTTLDGGVARGYMDVPQVDSSTWRNHPCLPSKACKLSSAVTTKAYSAAGQAASDLHAMAILQVHQAKALRAAPGWA